MAVAGFDWDEGNLTKCQKHGVSLREIEHVLRAPILTFPDKPNDAGEERFRVFGKTDTGRSAFVVYMLRNVAGKQLIRPISARYMHQREVKAYEEAISTLRK